MNVLNLLNFSTHFHTCSMYFMNKYVTMSESSHSSSSSSLTDGLRFVLEEDSDDTEVLKCMVDDETKMKT